jgi:predicted alpha/beta-fold hydrolase
MGFSMGSATFGNYLCNEGDKSPLTAVINVSCFFSSSRAIRYVKKAFFGIYDKILCAAVKGA